MLTACDSRILQTLKRKWKERPHPEIMSHKLAVVALYVSELKMQAKLHFTRYEGLSRAEPEEDNSMF